MRTDLLTADSHHVDVDRKLQLEEGIEYSNQAGGPEALSYAPGVSSCVS
jgi:hypothetical protein